MLNVDPTQRTLVQIIDREQFPIRAIYPQQEFEDQTYFDYAAELHMSAHKFHPADVNMALWFTNSYARKLARVAGEVLPERGVIPDTCRDIFRYNLMKAHLTRQAHDMEALTHYPAIHLN